MGLGGPNYLCSNGAWDHNRVCIFPHVLIYSGTLGYNYRVVIGPLDHGAVIEACEDPRRTVKIGSWIPGTAEPLLGLDNERDLPGPPKVCRMMSFGRC